MINKLSLDVTQLEFTIGTSDSGYINAAVLYEYLCDDFCEWLTANNVKRPVVIWTDWHESRNGYWLARKLSQLNIILYGLPPNTTHLLQPLDVSVFGPLKKQWPKAVHEWEKANPDKVFGKYDFAKVFLPFYNTFATVQNIVNGFRKCGIVPMNEDAPDYSKLESNAAQRQHSSVLTESIDQGETNLNMFP